MTDTQRSSCLARRPLRLAVSMAAALVLAGCGNLSDDRGVGGAEADTSEANAQINEPDVMEYQIGPSDVLSINVWNHEELDRTVTVRPDGMISFPLVGEVLVVGLTPAQLQDVMETGLTEYINVLPGEVSVIVDEVHSYTVSVLGRVNEPGRFEFRSKVTVLDALAQAGGVTDFADTDDILILRPGPEQVRRLHFDYREVLRSDREDARLFVYPGDIVMVP